MSKMTALIWSGVGLGAGAGFGVGFGAADADADEEAAADAGAWAGADADFCSADVQESDVQAGDIQTRCVIQNHFLSKLCKSLRVLSNATDLMNSITTPPQES